MLERIKTYFQEVIQEFRHINWPTRQEAIRLTWVVIGISLGLALFLGVLDGIFRFALETFIAK
ncbi:MAG: preprotein translocase subunit SecE [Patescibacteria group bacterium]